MPAKASIVFAHGLWADGSCFSKVIPALQADGHQVVAAQNSLDTLEGDVAAVTSALGRVASPAILVGHSYGGTVITAAGTDDRVAGLVYIAALAPDEDETSQSLQEQFPVTVLDVIRTAANSI
jgi:pimeloyl-ACP methyl ester carboxylesterase